MEQSKRRTAKRKCEGEEEPAVLDKRIASPERCEVIAVEEDWFTSLARFNTDDHFSRINDDCILTILKLFAKNDLYSVARTSKKFRKMCKDESLKLPELRWEARLIIFPVMSGGYGFRIIAANKHERLRSPLDVCTWDGLNSLQWTKMNEKKAEIVSCEWMGSRLTDIPQTFYNQLINIVDHKKYTITSLSIRKMKFDNRLFAKLHEVFPNDIISKIEFIKMPCENTEESMQITRKSFAALIYDARIVDLSRLSPNASQIINQELIQFISHNTDQCELRTNYSPDVPHMNCFRPARDYFKLLERFSIFDVVPMIVDSAWIIKLIGRFLRTRSLPEDRPVFWRFSAENTDVLFRADYVFPYESRYKAKNENGIFEIECKATGKMARIYREKGHEYVEDNGDEENTLERKEIKVVTVIIFEKENRDRVRSNSLTYLPLK